MLLSAVWFENAGVKGVGEELQKLLGQHVRQSMDCLASRSLNRQVCRSSVLPPAACVALPVGPEASAPALPFHLPLSSNSKCSATHAGVGPIHLAQQGGACVVRRSEPRDARCGLPPNVGQPASFAEHLRLRLLPALDDRHQVLPGMQERQACESGGGGAAGCRQQQRSM